MLLLLATYGLRSREIAALTLDDIDWKRARLAVLSRKAGHSTAFPLSHVVGEALVDYLKHGRPRTADRRVFFRAVAPVAPIGHAAISSRARHYLLVAGIEVHRPGSHAAPQLRATTRRRGLLAEDDRRLRRSPLPAVDRGLREGGGRVAA